MYIIVIGGGRIGYYLLKALMDEGHEVLMLEKDPRVCRIISDELGSVCIRGDGCEAATLSEVGTGRADMLVAVTGDDEDNMVACQVAKFKFNVPSTIARVRNPQNEALFQKLGVDVTVSATKIILEAIEQEVPTHPLTHLLTIRDKGLEIVSVRIPLESTTVGKSVKELKLPQGSKLALIVPRKHNPHLPSANTVLRAGDQIIAIISPESEEELRAVLGGT
ncbi:potassium channel family protein [Chloroflexota bacterium]